MLLLLLATGCQEEEWKPHHYPEGDTSSEGPGPGGFPPGDSGGTEDSAPPDSEPLDTDSEPPDTDSEPPDTGGDGGGDGGDGGSDTTRVCYPGEDESWSTCLDVVAWSSGWGGDYEYPDPYGGDPQYSAPARYLDLSAQDPDLGLAPNFVLSEFMQESKGRYGVFQAHTVDHIQQIRDRVGGPVYINSGYRNVSYNASVGGVSSSRHMYGDALDFYADDASLSTLEDYCYDEGAGYVGLYTSHIHCDWRDDPLDSAFYDVGSFTGPVSHDEFGVSIDRSLPWSVLTRGWDEGEPLKVWRALDASGAELDRATSPTYTPPEGAARVELTVGGHFTLVMTP